MKFDNRDLVLKGLLGVLPLRLERYVRSLLGNRCTPETLRRLLAADTAGPVPEIPNLADLSTLIVLIRALAVHGDGGRRPPLPSGLMAALEEVWHFRDKAIPARPISTGRALAALDVVDEVLRLIGAESGRDEIRELISALDGGRGPRRGLLDAVDVEAECADVVGYAHAVAGARSTVSIRLSRRSRAASDPHPVKVTLTVIENDDGHAITEPRHLTWEASALELNTTCSLVLNRTNLLQVGQAGSTHVRIELRAADGTTAVHQVPGPAVLPPRQWRLAGGEQWAGLALATFVQPDQGAVKALVSEARGLVDTDGAGIAPRLRPEPGPADTGWLDVLVAAACSALRRQRLSIEEVNGPWDREPHSVRTGAETLGARTGTTLDVVVLLAGVLEHLGVSAVLLLTPTAALLGYWRSKKDTRRVSTSPQEAVELVRSGALGLVCPKLAVCGSTSTLHELIGQMRDLAPKALSDLILIVPVGAARKQGASPQPLLELGEDGVVVELPASDTDSHHTVAPIIAAPLTSAEKPSAPKRVEAWKRSLLDLSLRNPLIDRVSRQVVKLLVPPELIGRFEDIVNSGELVTLISRGAGLRGASDLKSRTAMLTEERIVGVDLPASDCRQRLQALAASARTALEETGANNLYLAVGTLTWRIDRRRLHSPLILIPVTLVRDGDTDGIVLDQADASTPNRSLLARYEADTGIDLVELREPVRDEHGVDVEATLAALRARIESSGRDDAVEASVHLGLFRFSTYRMWRDLEDGWRTIADNPLVAHLLDESGAPFADPADGADGTPSSQSGAPPARVGDGAVLFGDPATGAPTADQWAAAAGTINYEVVTRLGDRIPRIRIRAGRGQ